MEYFGRAAIAVPRDPEAITGAIDRVLADPNLRADMTRAGRDRLGEPGASAAIAGDILGLIERSTGARGSGL